MEALSDEELLAGLSSSASRETINAVFEQILARYQRRVVSWCYGFTRDREASADLAQEVFLKAFRHCASFRGDSRLSTWLFSIARNHCLNAIKRGHEQTIALEAAPQSALCEKPAPRTAQADRDELCHQLLRLMTRTLEPLEVRVMTLHYAHDVSLAAITRQLALTNPSGAKAYIVNARRKLNRVASRRGWHSALIGHTPAWRSHTAA